MDALAIDAAKRAGVRAQAIELDVAAAVDASSVAAVGNPRARGFQAAELTEIAREPCMLEVRDQRRDGLIAAIGRRSRELDELALLRALRVLAKLRDERLPALFDQAAQLIHLLRRKCHRASSFRAWSPQCKDCSAQGPAA